MAHYAKLDENNIVTEVIVVANLEAPDEATGIEFINSLGLDGIWKQTSYNSYAGIHTGPDGQLDGGIALRKNYAVIGYTYDNKRDAFIPPSPYPSWVIDEATCQWVAPVTRPTPTLTTGWKWNENTVSWESFTKTAN